MAETLLQMSKISIAFPGVKALDEVDFTAKTGRIHALIGANGAGKSTLMKVLSGAYAHYSGGITVDGQDITIRNPKQAKKAGIQIVYQEVDTVLIPYLTVAENIMLDETVHQSKKGLWVNWRKLHKKAAALLKDMNINISTRKLVSELTLAEKQMVLIARAISTECKFLILDEPTAPLSHTETAELFRLVRTLKEQNVGIIFISHRLPEIFEVCEEITIMRNGRLVIHEQLANLTSNKIVEYMLGKKLEEQFPISNHRFGTKVLQVNDLCDKGKLKNIDMYVKAGEIVGIAGLVGAGKTELCKALFGAANITSGEVWRKGKRIPLKNSHSAVKCGIALVPEERRKEGILVQESVAVNISSANMSRFTKAFGFIDRKAEMKTAEEMIAKLGIKTPSHETKVQNLSGGNQQKVAIGKWLVTEADIYIFDEPTKGVDVGAKKDIFELITALAKRGKAVIYASAELPEIIGITNRIYVLYDGENVKELKTNSTNEEEILYYSTGGKQHGSQYPIRTEYEQA